MSQTDRIISAMTKGWCSTRDLIDASGSLTPLARLAEWRRTNEQWSIGRSGYPEFYYLIHGNDYTEKTRTRKVKNRDGTKVQIIERRLQRVK